MSLKLGSPRAAGGLGNLVAEDESSKESTAAGKVPSDAGAGAAAVDGNVEV